MSDPDPGGSGQDPAAPRPKWSRYRPNRAQREASPDQAKAGGPPNRPGERPSFLVAGGPDEPDGRAGSPGGDTRGDGSARLSWPRGWPH